MSDRLRNIIKIARTLDEEYARAGLHGPNQSREAVLVEALVWLAGVVDDYIDAQADYADRERAYTALFEAVREPVVVEST